MMNSSSEIEPDSSSSIFLKKVRNFFTALDGTLRWVSTVSTSF